MHRAHCLSYGEVQANIEREKERVQKAKESQKMEHKGDVSERVAVEKSKSRAQSSLSLSLGFVPTSRKEQRFASS